LCKASNEEVSEFNLPELEFNDKAESVWCGEKIDIQICTDGLDKCHEKGTQSGSGSFKNPRIGKRNKATSVKLWSYDELVKPAVILFKDSNCSEWFQRFYGSETLNEKISYTTEDLEDQHFFNDSLSSIAIPYGTTVELYKDDDFSGDSIVMRGKQYEDI